jgi:hypothetical protein
MFVIRNSTPADAARVRELAALDSRRSPAGELLVGEVDGELVAAVSLTGEGSVADPFRPTADLVTLLKLRAAQLGGVAARRAQRSSRRLAEAALAA